MQYKVSTRTEFRGRSNFSPRKNNVFVARKKRAGSGAGKRSSFFKKIKPINPSSSRKRETFFQLAVIQPLCQTYIGLFLKQKKKKKEKRILSCLLAHNSSSMKLPTIRLSKPSAQTTIILQRD